MGNPAEEREVFTGFLRAAPDFADAPVANWIQPSKDPPDVDANLVDGRRIAVELTSWLDESQIGRAKKTEMLERSFDDAIRPVPANDTEHIHLVWMNPARPVKPADRASFRSELLRLMDVIDAVWETIPDSDSPQGFDWSDFNRFPALAKYLHSVHIHPRRSAAPSTMKRGGLGWLTFPAQGGAYSPGSMVDALLECLTAKTTKYSSKPTGAAAFHLLVHYDKAYLYNSPVIGVDFDYEDAVKLAAVRLGGAGVFDKIFVFVPIAEGAQVFQLYP